MQDLSVNIKLPLLLGIAPELRAYLHKDSRAILVPPNVTKVDNNYLELDQVNELDEEEELVDQSYYEVCLVTSDNDNNDEGNISKPLIRFQVLLDNNVISCLYDPGSNTSLINKETVQRLKLKTEPAEAVVAGIVPGITEITELV